MLCLDVMQIRNASQFMTMDALAMITAFAKMKQGGRNIPDRKRAEHHAFILNQVNIFNVLYAKLYL